MRAALLLVPVLLAGAAPVPTWAQLVGRPNYGPVFPADPFLGNGRLPGPSIGRELRDIRSGIERSRESGLLSAREARGLRRQATLIGTLLNRYGRNGLSDSEHRELQSRTLYLREAVGRTSAPKTGKRGR